MRYKPGERTGAAPTEGWPVRWPSFSGRFALFHLPLADLLFQSGKSQGLSGAIGGIADSYMSKGKARTVDAKLAKATKWVGAVFVILTLVLDCMVAAGL